MSTPPRRNPKVLSKKSSVITYEGICKEKEEVEKYSRYFEGIISEYAPKKIEKVEKALIDPLSPFEVKTGSVTKYGYRDLDDWEAFSHFRPDRNADTLPEKKVNKHALTKAKGYQLLEKIKAKQRIDNIEANGQDKKEGIATAVLTASHDTPQNSLKIKSKKYASRAMSIPLFDVVDANELDLKHREAIYAAEDLSLPALIQQTNDNCTTSATSNSLWDDDEKRPLYLRQSMIDENFLNRAKEAKEFEDEAKLIPRLPSRYKSISSSTFRTSKLPPLVYPKVDKYFGESSRVNFYQTYRDINQQRNRFYTDDDASASLSEDQKNLDKEIDELSSSCPWSCVDYSESHDERMTLSMSSEEEDIDEATGRPRYDIYCGSRNDSFPGDDDNSSVASANTSFSHVSAQSNQSYLTKSYGPNSPRARYLAGCLQGNIAPRCAMLLRGKKTTSLWLDHLGMGDKLGVLLASGLKDMPMITSVNLTDNNLTDVSLKPLIDAIAGNPSITELFLSQNKIDSDASGALADYLSSPDCTLAKLVMRKADIDDGECHSFVEVLKNNKTLTHLDMSDNLLGKDENLNAVNPDIVTGGESLAMLLTEGDCALTHLIVSWNMIRMEGAVDIANSLRGLRNLVHLDIAFNSFAADAGGVIGNALLDNSVLEELIVSSNNLEGSAAFAICIGARESANLKYLNIDGNPIGEAGARILMTLPLTRGNHLVFSARDCDVSIRYPQCSYDCSSPDGYYRLELAEPYQYAVFLDLLDSVAKNPSYYFGDCKYFEQTDDSNEFETLEFSHYSEQLPEDSISERSQKEVSDMTANKKVSENAEYCREKFMEYDYAHKGELTSDQFFALIDDLGFVFNSKMKSLVMNIYDNDRSGSIEFEEYMMFISKMNMDATHRIRDIESIERSCLASTPNKRYLPPRRGIAHLEVRKSYDASEDCRALTAEQCENILRSAKNTSHPGKVVTYAADRDRLRYAEAFELFKVLQNEASNPTATLGALLPQMVSASDANGLAFCSGGDQEKIRARVENALGAAYRPIMGIADGYYALDLAKEKDRKCLQKLFEIGSAIMKNRIKHSLGDLSQDGNWSCFRNEFMDGKSVSISPGFMTPMPQSGKIEFDFSGPQPPLKSAVALTDRKFVALLWEMHLCTGKNESWIYDQLSEMKDAALKSLSSPGSNVYFQPDLGKMLEVQRYLHDKLYSKLSERNMHYEHALKREVASLLEARPLTKLQRQATNNTFRSTRVVVKDGQAKIVNRPTESNSSDDDSSISGEEDIVQDDAFIENYLEKSNSTDNANDDEPCTSSHRAAAMESSNTKLLEEIYENHPKNAASCLAQLERIVSCFVSKCIYARHLAALVMLFLKGTCKKTDWGTYRVELIVSLFSRVKDNHNFDLVLAQLNADEHAMVIARIGILNIFNPLKPEGGYCLDLGVWEERQVAKILVHFACVEPGANWFYQEYRFDRRQPGIPGWELPVTWLSEGGMPKKGILSLVYYAGGGLRLLGCNPTMKLREAALSLTLIHPSHVTFEKKSSWPALRFCDDCTISSMNSMLASAGIAWNYLNAKNE